MSDNADSWVRRFHPSPGAAARLVCLPHAGGSASYFFPVSRALAPRVEVLAIQYPGRQDRRQEKCLESIEALADALVGIVAPYADKPLTLFGHSLGASLGFELALRLERAGVRLAGLIPSARRAPSAVRDERNHLLPDDGLLREIKQLNGTESQLLDDDEILRMVLPSIRADYKAAETYRPATLEQVSCPVLALTGDADPKATVAEVAQWENHTTGRFEMEVYPGGHFYLNAIVPQVLARITKQIDSTLATAE
ncbi:thioesterase [Actinokineospora bangkokensis]|uniref:Thioesterase n=2 Tax=Actinokineospora bangkokensis TaxID=1193682 RepID=A0A1Q9LH43_9PSEU|nr:thioesterase [Actinokineospora bangkokensis]